MTSNNPIPTNSRSDRPSFLRTRSASSIKHKPRLYIALCPRYSSASFSRTDANCDSYHWTLLVSEKSSHRSARGTRYHVEHAGGSEHRYFYVEDDAPYIPAAESILVRVAVAKVVDTARLQMILRAAPIHHDDLSWNCLSWVKESFERLVEDEQRCVKGYVDARDWREMEKKTREYVKRKRDERRQTGDIIPTWNYWENRETTN